MGRYLVVLKIAEGSFEAGFPVTLQIGKEGSQPIVEIAGKLPANLELPLFYDEWRSMYLNLDQRIRLSADPVQVTNVSVVSDCQQAAERFRIQFNQWLQAESFRAVREKWLEKLVPTDELRIVLQTQNFYLQRFPWHLWELLDRYPNAEIALSTPVYETLPTKHLATAKVRILAILGDAQHIDVEADRLLLSEIPNADVTFLIEPTREQLTDQFWQQHWNILFFAGHSTSNTNGDLGQIRINATESLTIAQLKYALRNAVANGLTLAIFNSCDGLGLAHELAQLHIPRLIVMREPVPDQVAQAFLKHFLAAFSHGEALHLAVRQARERLQGLEHQFPCATWLPMLCQSPAQPPFRWADLVRKPRSRHRRSLPRTAIRAMIVAVALGGVRFLGLLQPLELMAFDTLLRSRPEEGRDPRLLLVTIDDDDIRAQSSGRGSLSDDALNRLLIKLEANQPRAIGLGIYRDFPVANQADLKKHLQNSSTLIATCKVSDSENNLKGIAPPPEVVPDQIGFSDFLDDRDGKLRRQILWLTPEPTSVCTTPYAFSLQLAFRYLNAEGIDPQFTQREELQLGNTIFHRLPAYFGGYQGIDARGNQILLNYRSTRHVATQASLSDVLQNKLNPEAIRNRIVLVGVTAKSTGDYWSTVYGAGATEQLPGIVVQAHMVSQLLSAVLDGRSLMWTLPMWADWLWIASWTLLSGILSGLMLQRAGKWQLGLTIALLCIALYGVCFGVLVRGGWLPIVPSLLGILIGSGSELVLQRAQDDRRNELID